MKSIAICYGEHAVKISDSYCSGHSNQAYNSSNLITPSIQNAVTCMYKIKLSNTKQFFINLTWCNLLNQVIFSISILDNQFSTSEISFKILRGAQHFEFNGLKIEVFWDLSRAKYANGPEPIRGFYVIILVNSELSLLLGDMENELDAKKRVCNARKSEFSLISRSEIFSGNGVYSTRAKFCDNGTCHDILIKCCGEEQVKVINNPVLFVYVDKKNVIEVKRLRWNFRGNETIFMDGLLVDFMWDVHDWFNGPASGYAVFLFRTRRGLDSRLWLEDRKIEKNEDEKVGFSFLICACKIPD